MSTSPNEAGAGRRCVWQLGLVGLASPTVSPRPAAGVHLVGFVQIFVFVRACQQRKIKSLHFEEVIFAVVLFTFVYSWMTNVLYHLFHFCNPIFNFCELNDVCKRSAG